MSFRRICVGTSLVAFVLALTGEVRAEGSHEGDKAAAQEAKMKAAWEAVAKPSEGHAVLKSLAGSWSATTKMWMDPAKQPETTAGSCEGKLVFGDRFLEENFQGQAMGQPFTGRGYTGYNNASKKYESVWMDSMGTSIMFMSGTLDKSGKVLTMTGETVDPMTKKMSQFRTVTRIESDKLHVFEMYKKERGKELKMLEITYAKK